MLDHHTDHHSKIIKVTKQNWWLTASAALSFFLILLGAATLVFVQKPIQESQDLRQQASVADGQVTMAFTPPTGENLPVGQPASVDFQVNTNGVQLYGLQFVFNVVTDTLTTSPEFVLAANSNLQVYQSTQQVDDGYLLSVILISQTLGQPISTASLTTLGHLDFTPASVGPLAINFDEDYSAATVFGSSPLTDELRNIDPLSYTIVAAATATPSASPAVSPSPSATTSPSPTPSPTPTPTMTPSPTPTPTPGTGGVVSCNQSCSSNADCAVNHRCYNNQCRLVTNVSSTTCSAATTPDNGLNRTCNQYCADNRECMSGYSCHYNRCRNPLNLESTSCAVPSQAVVQSMAASCNKGCSTHKDCAANLFCHTSGTCRLVTNPASTSCTPAAYNSVSNMYGNKGGNGTGPTKTDGISPTSTSKPVTATVSATPKVTSSPQPGADDQEALPLKKSALQNFWDYFMIQLSSRGISLPIFFIVLGLALLLVVIVIALLLRLLSGGTNQPPVILPVGKDRDKEKDTKYENQLATKINSLQQAPESKPVPANTSAVPPSAMMAKPAPTPSPLPPVPPATPVQSSAPSTMMSRLQDKGIKPPQG